MSRADAGQGRRGRGFEVFCGIDVARETHHGVVLDRLGRRLIDRPLPNGEPQLVALFNELESRVDCWWWLTSWPRSVRWRSRLPARAASRWVIFPASR